MMLILQVGVFIGVFRFFLVLIVSVHNNEFSLVYGGE